MYSQRHEVLPKSQVAVMNSDGSNVRVVTNTVGYKGWPTFSHSGKQIIFSQAGTIRDSGATIAANWDLWEVDLETGAVGLFAGPFRFYQMGLSVYLPDDQRVLLDGETPSGQVGPGRPLASSFEEYRQRYGRSNVFVVRRGQKVLDPPLFTDLGGASWPILDASGNIFFKADGGPTEGIRIRRQRPDGQRDSWRHPPESSNSWGSDVSRDGRHFVVSVTVKGAPQHVRKLMLLDTTTGEWRQIVLPRDARQINR